MIAKKMTLEDVHNLRIACERYQLEGRQIIDCHSDEELLHIFNGIGSESFPLWMKELLDSLHPSLVCPSMIHDVEWEHSDGTEEGFRESNDRFRRNGIKIASIEFKWYDPRRYVVMFDAIKFAALCQMFGWTIWARERIKKANAIARAIISFANEKNG